MEHKSHFKELTIKDFNDLLDSKSNKNDKFICIFKGSIDPETNQNWCGDCIKA